MIEFKENKRQGVIVYLYRLRQSRQLKKFGQIMYVSKKMKYVLLYMDENQVDQNIKKLNKLKFVRKAIPSLRPFLKTDYANSEAEYRLTEEDKEKFKKTKSEIK